MLIRMPEPTQNNTNDNIDKIQKLRQELEQAETVIVGAGAGLSTAAGFTYSGERFHTYFKDFADKYHFRDMYAGGFFPYKTLNEHWAYWSRYIYVNRYMNPPKPLYQKLLELVKEKDYFVITTNGLSNSMSVWDFGKYHCSEYISS